MNLNSVRVDQRGFAGLLFLSCEPKREFGSQVQASTKDGRLKWEVQALAAMTDNFGKATNEVLIVGITSKENPAAGVRPLTPIEFGDLTCGFMPKTKKMQDGSERPIPGINVWLIASEIVNASEQVVDQGKAA